MRRILVIEDEPAIRLGIARSLSSKGFHVFEAADGKVRLLLSETLQPDLILCDINLPVIDGFAILRQVRGNSITASIPFVVLTSQTDEEIHQRSLELGASHFLSKPISFNELLTVVTHQLKVATS
jgi:DNA-binding response OmpR family regulator